MNDYYSVSYLPIDKGIYIEELNIISRIYRSNGIDSIYLSQEFDFSISVNNHLARSAHYFANARKSLCSNIKLIPINTVTLHGGLSDNVDLSRLSLKIVSGSYLYINVPINITRDIFAYELHNIVHKHKLKPIFVSTETIVQIFDDQMIETLFAVPNAIYLFSLPHITNYKTSELIKQLVISGKNVIFGSAESFDACPYNNIDYYLKHIKNTIGSDAFGYYRIRHNRIFT